MRNFDFVVLGAGINGVCTALALVRRGLNVALVEQFTAGHERGSSHGQVSTHVHVQCKYSVHAGDFEAFRSLVNCFSLGTNYQTSLWKTHVCSAYARSLLNLGIA